MDVHLSVTTRIYSSQKIIHADHVHLASEFFPDVIQRLAELIPAEFAGAVYVELHKDIKLDSMVALAGGFGAG
jgi:hypothetical protein